jgi:hypothetical protein
VVTAVAISMNVIQKLIKTHHDAKSVKGWLRYLIWRSRLRWQRRIDKAFDAKFGVDTADEVLLTKAGITSDVQAAQGNTVYRPLWESAFRDLLRLIPLAPETLTFVDIGAGKGKLLLLASRLPFKRIIGIEYAETLHNIAVENIRAFRPHQVCRSVKSYHQDALTFDVPLGEPLVCTIFNSFDVDIMKQVLLRLGKQANATAAPVFVVYVNVRDMDEMRDAFTVDTGLRTLLSTRRFVLWGNASAAHASGRK